MSPVRIIRHERGPRVYVIGLRCHHGATGAAALALGAALRGHAPRALTRGAAAVGALLLWHDRADFPFTDKCNH